MSLSSAFSRMSPYIGNGTTATFAYTFKAREATDLVVYVKKASTGVQTKLLLSTDFTVTGLNNKNGGTVVLVNAGQEWLDSSGFLAFGYSLLLMRVRPLTQDASIKNGGDFYPETHEKVWDHLTMLSQQLQEQIDRCIKAFETQEPGEFDLRLKKPPSPGARLVANEDLDGFDWDDGTTGGAITGTIGLPTDGAFGTAGGISGLLDTDTPADGFDKVEGILEKLVPAPPALLSATPLVLFGAYTALEAGTGSPTTNCTDDTTPRATATNFRDGNSGTLSAAIDLSPSGSITLSPASDVGSNDSLFITADTDPYAGQSGKEGFWAQLTAYIEPAAPLSIGGHNYKLSHSTTGDSSLAFTVDDPGIVTFSSASASSSGSSSYVSGVPGLAQGQAIACSVNVINAVRTHYNATRVLAIACPQAGSANVNPGAVPANGATLALAANLLAQASAYTENAVITFTGYNSAGFGGSTTQNSGVRIDTISNESARRKSGQGQYPAAGSGASQYGDAFVSSTSLATAGNEELQMLGGRYQYPPAVNYSTSYPVGPNYSALSAGTYLNMRWVTLNLGSISAAVTTTLTINGGSGFSSALESGLAFYVRVDGATPTSGWIDANAAYPGVGNPTNNGDAALVVGSSSASVKVVTFGASPKTGNVIVRIGIPSGSSKSFTGITRS